MEEHPEQSLQKTWPRRNHYICTGIRVNRIYVYEEKTQAS